MKKKRISIIDQILLDDVEDGTKVVSDTTSDADSYLNFLSNFNRFIEDDLIDRQERYIDLFNSLCKLFPNDYKSILAPIEKYTCVIPFVEQHAAKEVGTYALASKERLYSYLAALELFVATVTKI